MVGCGLRLNLTLQHDGGRGADLLSLVDLPVHDLDALEILLDEFLPRDLDVLLDLTAASLTKSIDHMLLDKNADLLGEVGSRREFRDSLADNETFGHITLTLADQILIG